MENKSYYEREDVKLRKQYDEGLIGSEEFLSKLFNSVAADRLRRAIVNENEKLLSNQ